MKRVMTFAAIGIAAAMTSACGQPEPLRTVSDYCLNSKRISAEPHPEGPTADDPGNQFDTEQTFGEVLEHNEVYDRLCKTNP